MLSSGLAQCLPSCYCYLIWPDSLYIQKHVSFSRWWVSCQHILKIYFNMYLCMHVCMSVCMQWSVETKGDVASFGSGTIPDRGARRVTWVLWKTRKCSYSSDISAAPVPPCFAYNYPVLNVTKLSNNIYQTGYMTWLLSDFLFYFCHSFLLNPSSATGSLCGSMIFCRYYWLFVGVTCPGSPNG